MAQKYIKDDIVMYKNRIHTIIDTLGLNNYELSYVSHSVNQAELSGVPLTHEILEKNGWKTFIEQHDFRYAFKIDDLCYLVVMTGFLDGIRIFIRKGTIYDKLRTLKYVHQLQHLLFGLGLNSEMEV